MSIEEIVDRFAWHAATEADRVKAARAREIVTQAALQLVELTPPGREQSLMLTHLEDTLMRANRAIVMPGPNAGGRA